MKNLDNIILILNNNFNGSYNSNQYFYSEICRALKILGIKYISVSNVDDAVHVFENKNVSFSVCLGRYEYFIDSVPMYEKYCVMNYQWISDNPMKFTIDIKSKFIKYIFIDNQFQMMVGKLANEPLILPLGYLEEKSKDTGNDRVNGILFPGQIRSIESIKKEIRRSAVRRKITDFLDKYNLDTSYISAFNNAAIDVDLSDRWEFFRLTNSYTRTLKRIIAIENIHSVPVYIAGEKTDNNFKNNDVRFIGKFDYFHIEDVMSKYLYILNVDPNYHSCIHERISRGINAGAVVFSNENNIVNHVNNFPYVYRFDNRITIDSILKNKEFCFSDALEKEKNFIINTSWTRSLDRVIKDNEIYQR